MSEIADTIGEMFFGMSKSHFVNEKKAVCENKFEKR